jgi:type VI protein secretion system component VasK
MKSFLPNWLAKKFNKNTTPDPQVQLLKDALARQFTRQQVRYQPWVCLVGSDYAGKTNLCQTARFEQLPIPQAKFSIWRHPQSTLLSFGNYFLSQPDFWQDALSMLRRHRQRQPFDALALTVNLPQLTQQPSYNTDRLLEQLSTVSATIAQASVRKLPVYVIFTHCDLIAGFNEFFADLTQEQCQQVWGMFFEQDFEATWQSFITHLHGQVLLKLHNAQDAKHTQLIKEFPLQLENLAKFFHTLYHLLTNAHTKNKIGGFCFTGGQQMGATINYLTNTINQNAELSFDQKTGSPIKQGSYFCQQLMQQLLPFGQPENDYYYQRRNHKPWLINASALALLCLVSVYLIQQFQHTAVVLRDIQHELQSEPFNRFTQANKPQLLDIIQVLDSLETVSDKLMNNKSVWLFSAPFQDLAALPKHLSAIFQQILQRQLLPLLAHQIEQAMTTRQEESPDQTYRMLKAYLMLGNSSKLDPAYFIDWIDIFLRHDTTITPAQVARVFPFIQHAVNDSVTPVALDRQLIRNTRQHLAQLPSGLLTYLLIKDDYHTQFTQSSTPWLFTPTGFQKMVTTLIPATIQQLSRGDWVLGNILSDDTLSQTQLLDETLQIYTQDYVNWWRLFVSNSTIAKLNDIHNAQQTFARLAEEQSPLIELLLTIEENTSPLDDSEPFAEIFNQQIANQFINLSQVNEQSILALRQMAQGYARLFSELIQNQHQGQASLQQLATLARAQPDASTVTQDLQLANEQPELIRELLTTIIEQSWQLLADQAAVFLNQQWEQLVYRPYEQTIAQRFPFATESMHDVSLTDFQLFFKQDGVLQNFYQTYLADFIDTSQAQWFIKPLGISHFTLHKRLIAELQRTNIIRQMFFDTSGKKLSVNYHLQPLAFAVNTSSITLTVDNQKLFDYPGSTRKTQFHWPDKSTPSIAELVIQTHGSSTTTINLQGDWSWYRLFQSLPIEATQDTRHFMLSFNTQSGSVAAHYQLTSDKVINPFIPDIVTYFKLPKKLIA